MTLPPVRRLRAGETQHGTSPRAVARARRGWIHGRPVKELAGILGFKSEGGVYDFARRSRWPQRKSSTTLRQRAAARMRGLKRKGELPLEHEVQPLVPEITPERRCGRCRGYTDRRRCHRCGAAA